MARVLNKHIEKTADVRSGKARIAGTRTTVSDIRVIFTPSSDYG